MLRLVNKDRKKHGFKSLFMQDDLSDVARAHSKDMAKLDYFDHTNFAGQSHSDRYLDAKISDVVSGENLAKIGGFSHPVIRAEIGLMNSPGHRANILNKSYNCVGIGVHKSDRGVYYYTQNFAQRSLIFTKTVKKRIRKRKGLTLELKPVGNVKLGVYRVLEGTQILKEKGFQLRSGKNRLQIPLSRTGKFTVEIYTGSHSRNSLNMANRFEIKVTQGWFG